MAGMSDPCADLRRFARPGLIHADCGPGGLPRLSITSRLGRIEVFLLGAHLTAWEPAGQAPVLWMTRQARFASGTPIRGGVPICWPWFGPGRDPALPAHGCVRTRAWTCASAHVDADGEATVILELASDEATRRLFPHDWRLRYRITAGRGLDLSLTATNTGATAFPVSEALHTYLAVGDVRRIELAGLEGVDYLDRNESQGFHLLPVPPRARQEGAVTVAGEVDRHYLDPAAPARLRDPLWHRTLRMAKRGSHGTQVWNPWIDKARRLADLGDHEWPGFLCLEAANAFAGAYTLAPGESHELGCSFAVL